MNTQACRTINFVLRTLVIHVTKKIPKVTTLPEEANEH